MKTTLAAITSLATVAGLSLALAPAEVTTSAGAVAPVPAGATYEEVYFPSRDGTMLQADVLKPAQGCPEDGCPVIVSIGPYYGFGTQDLVWDPTNSGPSDRFSDLTGFVSPDDGRTIFEKGYAFVMVDSRGYGESGGCNDYGGIGEQMDAYAAVEHFGAAVWSNGKVGMWGKSYDAWTQVMALAENPPHLEAVVIQAPIIDGYGIAWVNGVHHDVGWYLTPFLYTLYDYTPTSLVEATPERVLHPTTGSATDPCWAEQHPYQAAGWDRTSEYWRQRDLRPSAGRNDDVAVLWSHGFNDVNTKPDQIFGVYEPLNHGNGDETRAWFGEWAHDRGNEVHKVGRDGFLAEAVDWFDHYLKGEDFFYGANEHNVVEVQDNEGSWRTEAVYPPSDVQRVPLAIPGGTYTDDGSGGAGSGYWAASEVLAHDLRIAGEPTLTVEASFPGPFANLVGVLYDLHPDGTAIEIARTAVRLEGDGPQEVRMHPRDHILRAGHQLAFHVTSGHHEFFPYSTQQDVEVTSLTVGVPFLTYERVSNLDGGPSSRSPYRTTVGVDTLAGAGLIEGLPGPMIEPLPPQRRELQPDVTTGCDTDCAPDRG
ncbi:MAG: CocE/NonD family hydrolase [Actinobacteria bacterium]|nr:CocE/NonD family hydrolase [Actinomycetota bacterium]